MDYFFLEKQLFKQDDSSTDSGALTGGIVTIAIVLLALGIIVAIYRKQARLNILFIIYDFINIWISGTKLLFVCIDSSKIREIRIYPENRIIIMFAVNYI